MLRNRWPLATMNDLLLNDLDESLDWRRRDQRYFKRGARKSRRRPLKTEQDRRQAISAII